MTTATAQMTSPEFVSRVAALCGIDEAALVLVYAEDGISYCISSDQGAHETAIAVASAGQDDEDTLLGVAVISRNGTITEYAVRNDPEMFGEAWMAEAESGSASTGAWVESAGEVYATAQAEGLAAADLDKEA